MVDFIIIVDLRITGACVAILVDSPYCCAYTLRSAGAQALTLSSAIDISLLWSEDSHRVVGFFGYLVC